SGPPRGMYFSRRKLTVPLPPRPASTRMSASSTNFTDHRPRTPDGSPRRKKPRRAGLSSSHTRRGSVRHDADVQALLRTLRLERDAAVREREQRVVAADADGRAGGVTGPAPAHENVPREDLLAAEALDAKPFRFRIAAVLRAAAGFLVCHRKFS